MILRFYSIKTIFRPTTELTLKDLISRLARVYHSLRLCDTSIFNLYRIAYKSGYRFENLEFQVQKNKKLLRSTLNPTKTTLAASGPKNYCPFRQMVYVTKKTILSQQKVVFVGKWSLLRSLRS